MAYYAEITNIVAPSEPMEGQEVDITVSVRNPSVGAATVTVAATRTGGSDLQFGSYQVIESDEVVDFTDSFIMPNYTVTLNIWSWYWNGDEWVHDDDVMIDISPEGDSGPTGLDCTEQHTAHITLDVSGSFNALVMLGIGYFPSAFLDWMDPDDEDSCGGKKTVSLSGGEQIVDILIGLNHYDKWHDSGWSTESVVVLYVEDADSGDVIVDDTEVNGMAQLYKP